MPRSSLSPQALMDYQPYLCQLAKRLNLPENEIEDLVQETIIYAWDERIGYDPNRGTLKTWLYLMMRSWWFAELDIRRLQDPDLRARQNKVGQR